MALKIREKPVDRGRCMGDISIHFSRDNKMRVTLVDAVLFAFSEGLVVLAPSTECIYIGKFSQGQVCAHVGVAFSVHVLEFLEFKAQQVGFCQTAIIVD